MTRRLRPFLLPVLCLFSCTNSTQGTKGPAAEPTLISAQTSGVVSRTASPRIRFVSDEAPPTAIGTPLANSPFTFTPAVEGKAQWVDAREVEFVPKQPLTAGAHYSVSVDLSKLELASKPKQSTFAFEFNVMPQAFDLALGGLEAMDSTKPELQRLSGTVTTADVDAPDKVEAGLSLTGDDGKLARKWTHDPDRKRHTFTIEGLLRTENDREVAATFDGAGLGVARKDTKTLSLAGLNNFSVLSAMAVDQPERHLEVRFSDALKKGQKFEGLVKVGTRRDVRFTADGNVLKGYVTGAWAATEHVTVAAALKNAAGFALRASGEFDVAFTPPKPEVRFATTGAILPSTQGLIIPVETMNLRSVTIEARQVFDSNIPQFLQVNQLTGMAEMQRVGRLVWRKTVSLHLDASQRNRWLHTGLDLTPVVKNNRAGLYHLELSFSQANVALECLGQTADVPDSPAELDDDLPKPQKDTSAWDSAENYYGGGEENCWEQREDPCSKCYYGGYGQGSQKVGRNVLLSDLGLIAKRGGDDTLVIVATDLKTAAPQAGVAVRVLDYQQQPLGTGTTGDDGIARVKVDRRPFLVTATKDTQQGFLRVDDGNAVAMSHFDISGAQIAKGLKGFLYGERGVWRPGDTLFLGFMLFDATQRLPPEHPVKLDVLNARGQLVKTITSTKGVNNLHTFSVPTSPDDPTGTWLARATVGGATFELPLKVEAVMPNRLKLHFDVGVPMLKANESLATKLTAAWLHGAPAKNLKADVRVGLASMTTTFDRYGEFTFDDPTRRVASEPETIFDGTLDENGATPITVKVPAGNDAPGMLRADFSARVFEPGGSASVDRFSVPLSAYDEYAGVKLPKGDVARNMLLTDTKHPVQVVTLSADGKPVSGDVEVKLYKAQWRWWWEKGDENADYVASQSLQELQTGTVHCENGAGTWTLEVKYPDWGRYLVTARDLKSGHRTGRFLYIDWPGWAGRSQKDNPGGAAVLTVAADKAEYTLGEAVTITFPTPPKSRALVSVENGSRVLQTAWVEASGEQAKWQFTPTAAMAPNVYVTVTLLQPHLQANNDLPLRLTGVTPVKVIDPSTRLTPVIDAPESFVPAETGHLVVSEKQGRAMTYTLALVDEGLLDLTRFKTPDPWATFYAREALGVKTFDLYDLVSGASTIAPEKLLTIGGDGSNGPKEGAKANRFPPMVRFLGPFTLAAGEKKDHALDIPHYVGAVRAMVVASQGAGFGSAEKSIFVRKPLMVLATLPRVLGPGEDVSVPVSVFALDPSITKVNVKVTVEGPLAFVGSAEKALTFNSVGDQLAEFKVKVSQRTGIAKLTVVATGGSQTAQQTIEVAVRMPSLPASEAVAITLQPNETWEQDLALVGMPGTNTVTVEASRVPPLNLGERLQYLLQYPHGCVEQTTSSVFPQLYLSKLLELSPERQERIASNVKAGIDRLRTFQTTEGGFGYWPGDPVANPWGTTYAGNFLVEAQKAGFPVPGFLLDGWKAYQRSQARSGNGAPLEQAYRLYTLALAGAPELGAMNQLRERPGLDGPTRWRLAAAYALAGQPEAATSLVQAAAVSVRTYRELDGTFGSELRDQAMILEALAVLKDGRAGQVALDVSKGLSAAHWLSTQETAWALVGLARFGQTAAKTGKIALTTKVDKTEQQLTSAAAIVDRSLELGASTQKPHVVLKNDGAEVLFVHVVSTGTPAPGQERAYQKDLGLTVKYADTEGNDVDVSRLDQGTDVVVTVTVTNRSATRQTLPQLAVSQLVPSGWEIHNERLDPSVRNLGADYRDIRDDRVYTYLALKPGESRTYTLLVNASYVGRFYLPMQSVEAMYDASVGARVPGRWVEVTRG